MALYCWSRVIKGTKWKTVIVSISLYLSWCCSLSSVCYHFISVSIFFPWQVSFSLSWCYSLCTFFYHFLSLYHLICHSFFFSFYSLFLKFLLNLNLSKTYHYHITICPSLCYSFLFRHFSLSRSLYSFFFSYIISLFSMYLFVILCFLFMSITRYTSFIFLCIILMPFIFLLYSLKTE